MITTIQSERPQDQQSISTIHRLAFQGEYEARLVENLRRTDRFIPQLSLVAESGGNLVGHILFTRIDVDTGKERIPVLALAPLGVLPAYQNQGIGSQLIQEGHQIARELGYRVVVVLGHPRYYPRFGYSPARAKGILPPIPWPDEAFMVCKLVPGALQGMHGTVIYPPEFDEG